MPGGDRTGPMGFGPLTGRGMGYCASPGARRRGFQHLRNVEVPGGPGRRGWRHRYHATGLFEWERWEESARRTERSPAWTSVDDLELLKDHESRLEEELRLIRGRMEAVRQEKTPD